MGDVKEEEEGNVEEEEEGDEGDEEREEEESGLVFDSWLWLLGVKPVKEFFE